MKLKITAILIVVMLLVSYMPVYAEADLPYIPEGAQQYWVYVMNGPAIMFITGPRPITVRDENGKTIVTGEGGKCYDYYNNKWNHYCDVTDSIYFANSEIVASNHDIAYEDGSGFFFLCPKVSPLVQTMEVTDFGTILKNFSAGLIPIVGLIVLLIAFRKAWAFLRSQLQS